MHVPYRTHGAARCVGVQQRQQRQVRGRAAPATRAGAAYETAGGGTAQPARATELPPGTNPEMLPEESDIAVPLLYAQSLKAVQQALAQADPAALIEDLVDANNAANATDLHLRAALDGRTATRGDAGGSPLNIPDSRSIADSLLRFP